MDLAIDLLNRIVELLPKDFRAPALFTFAVASGYFSIKKSRKSIADTLKKLDDHSVELRALIAQNPPNAAQLSEILLKVDRQREKSRSMLAKLGGDFSSQ